MEAPAKYHPSLDGLRAVCILFTIANHTPGNPGINGTVGVDIFFALSGYLITMLLVREFNDKGNVCLVCFYIRRAFRIIPLYFLTILLYIPSVYLAFYLMKNGKGVSDFYNALPYLVTFNSEWRTDDAGILFGHAWTLGIEEKYYLFWPVIFLFTGPSKRLLWLLPLMPLLFLLGEMSGRGYVGILAGAIAASIIETSQKSALLRISPHLWFAMMVTGYIIATAFQNTALNVLISLPAVLFIADLIHRPISIYKTVLTAGPLPWLGTLTYGIYLIHRLTGHVFEDIFPILNIEADFLVYFTLTYAGSVAAAFALQKTVEHPMIAIGKRLSRRYETRQARLRDEGAPQKAFQPD